MTHSPPKRLGLPTQERFPKAARIRQRRDFVHIQRHGRRIHTRHFAIILASGAQQRLGVTVSKRVAGAVGRNRIKRLVREVFRRNRQLFPPDCNVVMIARKGADGLSYLQVRVEVAQVRSVMRRALAGTGRGPRSKPVHSDAHGGAPASLVAAEQSGQCSSSSSKGRG